MSIKPQGERKASVLEASDPGLLGCSRAGHLPRAPLSRILHCLCAGASFGTGIPGLSQHPQPPVLQDPCTVASPSASKKSTSPSCHPAATASPQRVLELRSCPFTPECLTAAELRGAEHSSGDRPVAAPCTAPEVPGARAGEWAVRPCSEIKQSRLLSPALLSTPRCSLP